MNIIFLTGGQCYASFRACLPSFPAGFHPFRQTFGPRHRSFVDACTVGCGLFRTFRQQHHDDHRPLGNRASDFHIVTDADTVAHTHTIADADTSDHRTDRLAIDLPDLPGYMAGAKFDGSQTKVFADDRSIRWWILKGDKVVGNYTPEDTIAFGDPETFTDVEGVLTFRGNHYRNRPAWGTADINEKKLEIIWTHNIGSVSGHNSWWPGAGWTGQPLLVHWPEETRQIMGLNESAKAKDLVEVIYPVFDGKIYFLDLETGKRTRDPIHVGFSFKGTASADPRGYPLLYAGQGLREANGRKGTFYFISLT